MEQSLTSKSRLAAILVAAIALVWSPGIGSGSRLRTQPEESAILAQQLGPEGQSALRGIVQAGTLSDLRWPDFSDYQKNVQKFYESYGYSLPWVKGMEPTLEAQQVIAVLLQADQKGLSAEDYDGPRWSERLAKLKPAAAYPSESDAARFDLALTVSVMRYISDLHIGKVNPRHFDYGLDVEEKKYDLPEFLKNHVVDAPDVAGVLQQVEPPYPGYQRTIKALQTYLQLAKEFDGTPLPAIQKTISPGDSYPGVPQLLRLLRQIGDLALRPHVEPDDLSRRARGRGQKFSTPVRPD